MFGSKEREMIKTQRQISREIEGRDTETAIQESSPKECLVSDKSRKGLLILPPLYSLSANSNLV